MEKLKRSTCIRFIFPALIEYWPRVFRYLLVAALLLALTVLILVLNSFLSTYVIMYMLMQVHAHKFYFKLFRSSVDFEIGSYACSWARNFVFSSWVCVNFSSLYIVQIDIFHF